MSKEYSRVQRVADFIKRELAVLIQRELRDPRVGRPSVTDVDVSRDLSHAKVFVTFWGVETESEAQDMLSALNNTAGFLRSQLAHSSSMRTTPKLKFVFDSSIRRGEAVSSLIDQALAEDAKLASHQGSGSDER